MKTRRNFLTKSPPANTWNSSRCPATNGLHAVRSSQSLRNRIEFGHRTFLRAEAREVEYMHVLRDSVQQAVQRTVPVSCGRGPADTQGLSAATGHTCGG